MNTKILVLAAAVAGSLVPGAAFAGGVRLNFGGPLGQFTATPARGGAVEAPAATARPRASHAQAAQKSPRQVKAYAGSPAKSAPAAAKVATKGEQDKPSEAGAPESATSASPVAFGESATAVLARREASTGDAVGKEPAGQSSEAPPSGTPEPATPAAAPAPAAESDTKVAAAAPLGCKKFIPEIGITVSVDCEH